MRITRQAEIPESPYSRAERGKIAAMDEEPHGDAEEVVLFPEHLPAIATDPSDHGPRSSHELLEAMGSTLPPAGLREWLTIQLTQLDGQLRKPGPSKLAGITPEVAAYIQASEARAGLKAARGAYTKALNKLDHYSR